MNESRILILGAGNSQADAIEYCRSRGIFVAGCSYTNTDKGIPLLDDFRQSDIKDAEAVSRYARDCRADIVYSVGSDLAVPTIMKVSETLGLPHFISYDAAMLCHSKHLMRQALGQDFEGNAAFIVCETPEEAVTFDSYPAMMKPVDSQGQRGCFRVDSAEDIRRWFDISLGYSVCGKVIVETFIDGPEISVNSYRKDGRTLFSIVSDREVYDEYPGGLVKSHRVPSLFADEEVQKKAAQIVDRAADALGITDGPCYCQMKISNGRDPYILEIAPRLDGCHMWNLIRHATGVDLLDACFRHLLTGDPGIACGEGTPGGLIVTDAEPYELEFMNESTGAVFDPSLYDTSDAEYFRYYYNAGDVVSKVNGYYEKCGYMIRRIR